MDREIWKPYPKAPEYSVSTFGRIRGPRRLLRPRIKRRYLSVSIRRKSKPVHRIVLETFSGPPQAGKQCAHLDGNNLNNCLLNLRWVSPKENCEHRDVHGTTRRGDMHAMAHLSEEQVREIRRTYNGDLKFFRKKYGVSTGAIHAVIYLRKWKHLKPNAPSRIGPNTDVSQPIPNRWQLLLRDWR